MNGQMSGTFPSANDLQCPAPSICEQKCFLRSSFLRTGSYLVATFFAYKCHHLDCQHDIVEFDCPSWWKLNVDRVVYISGANYVRE